MRKTIMDFTINGDEYLVEAKWAHFSPENYEGEEIKLFKNGEEYNEFGTTWVGHKLTAEDVFELIIIAYVNDYREYDFKLVTENVKALKDDFVEYTDYACGNRKIAKKILGRWDIYELVFLTDKTAVYSNNEDGLMLLDAETGRVETDIEAFAISGAVDAYKKENILYITEAWKSYIKEFVDEQ